MNGMTTTHVHNTSTTNVATTTIESPTITPVATSRSFIESTWSSILDFFSSNLSGTDIPMWLIFAASGGLLVLVTCAVLLFRYCQKHKGFQDTPEYRPIQSERMMDGVRIDNFPQRNDDMSQRGDDMTQRDDEMQE